MYVQVLTITLHKDASYQVFMYELSVAMKEYYVKYRLQM